MQFRTPSRAGRTWLAFTLLLASALVQARGTEPEANPSEADVRLLTDVTRISVDVRQGAPLPPGGCVSGHSWHTGYGGCRRAVQETHTEHAACPAGFNGTQTRTRTRTNYVLQANSGDVGYGQWGGWSGWNQSGCQPAFKPGVSGPLVSVRSDNFTVYNALFIDNATGQLVCGWRRSYHGGESGDGGGSGSTDWSFGDYNRPDLGSRCSTSHPATVYGNSDREGSGDAGTPRSGTITVSSHVINGCSVSLTYTSTQSRNPQTLHHNRC